MSENGVMDRPRRSTRNSLASASSTPAGTPSSNPYKKPTYSGRGANETPTSSKNTNGTPTRGRRGRGRPPGRPSSGRGGYSGKPECMAVRADGRRSTGGSTTSSAGGGRRGAATSGGRRSTYSSRHEYEYHYGSDFDSDQNDSEEVEEDEIESDQESEHDSISLSPDNDSDSDFSVTSSKVTSSRIPSPPVPIWLDTDKVPDIPSLELPCSSDDLLLPSEFVVKAAEIYEPLRRFYQLVRLSPFRFEDFCAALANEDQSSLLAEIHIQLLRSVIREEDANGTLFGPNEVKDSIAAVMFFVDPITWPETIRSYLESDPTWKDVYEAMTSVEYPFCGPSVRLKVLTWLVDQFLTTQAVRETVLGDGTIFHDDHCRACNRVGDLICCESCPAVYHFGCLNIKDADDVPNEWKCSVCVKHQVPGVSDCQLEIESDGCLIRHERLGYDRHGRKYWFLVRRIIVESEDDSEVWYYSSRKQIEELLSRLDASNYEQILVENIRNIEEEIYRHCEITEEVTTLQNVSRRKTYLDAVNGKDEEEGVERMTRNKATGLYKLGHENLFKTYVNHFNTDPLAVGKGKNEERDRKRHLSHKFSLTTASECKYGIKDLAGCPRQIQINALRGALMNMETLLPTTLMHVNWPMLRKNWIINVTAGSCALDFSRAMIMISACIRNAVYNPVWSESTGHVRFSRSSLAEREERKKLEKMDKKGKDDEDDRLKGEPQYTKNPLPIRHQVYKQKGEEYRVHGRWGWIWLSKMRRCKPEDCREKGLLAGPHKHVIQVKNEHGKVKTMLIDPSVYCKLMAKRNLTVSGSPATPVKSAVNGDCDTTIESATPRTSTEEKSEDGKSEPENVEDSSSSSNKENADDVEMKDALEIEVSAKSKKNTEDIVKIDEDMEDGKVVESSKSPVEPKTEPMESDVVEEEKDTAETVMNGVLSCEEGSLANKVQSPEESKKEEVMDSEPPMEKSEVEKPVVNGVTDEDSKEDHEVVVDSNKVDGQPDEGPEESQTGVTGSGGVTSAASADSRADDSQNRKFRTELINVSNGISSSHRILYPKVARRSEFLDSLLQRRLTLASLEERNLKNTYGEETVAKAKPGLAQFEAEEKRRAQEADEYPGEEVVDDNLTLGGAYAYCCYSSECRKEALEFMKTKGKNRERIYEKICYSPMCRLKFCLQETTRFKQERLREIEKEKYLKTYKEIEEKRHYTLEGTSQKVCMKKIADCVPVTNSASTNGVAGAVQLNKKKSKIPAVKYPQTSSFQYASSKKPSILVLAPWELSKLARTSGRSFTPSGFFQNQKSGSWGWTYPCGRPTFRTAWQFKASHSNTMAAAAMQLRILYASIRWDDILTKIPYNDGRNQVHTDTEIITSEILNHRIVGRFMERVQYLRRMHVVPIDAPKTIREVTPSRHGLRKRKRAEIPDQTDPVVTEDWVDEEKLELWEIRFYGDRIDKKTTVIGGVTRYYDSNTPSTRTKSGIAIKQPEKYDPSPHPTHTGERKTYSSAHNSQQSGGQQQTVASSSSSCSSNSSFSDNVESTIEHVIRSQDVVKPGDSGKTVSAVKTAELMRETLETEMKMQRAVQFSKRDGHVKKGTITSNGAKPTTLQTPTASQQFQMQQKSATGGISPSVAAKTLIGTPTSSKVGSVVVGKKFFSNRQSTGATAGTDGPILTKRPLQNTITINKGAGGTISVVKTNPNQQMAATTQAQAIQGSGLQVPTTVAVTTLGGQQPTVGHPQPATAGASVVMPQQKLSVVRLPDGRLQVKGLLPGQHCYQTPDGKIHVTVSAAQVQLMQQHQQQLNASRSQQAIQGAPAAVTTATPSSNEQPVVTPNAEENVCSTAASTSPSTPVITSTTTMANEVAVSANGQQSQTPATTVAQQQPHIAVSQPVTQGVIQMPQTTQVVVSSQQNQQPVINIGNQAVKSTISTSTGLVTTTTQSRQGISIQQSQPQVMIQQPNGQHLLIQGHAAQALLQQHKLNTSQRAVLQGSVSGQQLIKQVTTAGGQQIALKSPVVVQTSTGPTVGGIVASTAGGQQVTGRIVIQDGKAVLIGAASVPTSQQRIVVNQKQVVQTTAAMVQSPQQQTIARPQVIQTSAGTTMQLIQSGQGLHLITQQTPTPPPEQIVVSGSTTSVTSVTSTESSTSSPVKSNASGSVTTGLSPSTITTAVRHVLPDGRTVLMSPGQLNDLGGRKVVLAGNKVIQIPTGAGATIQGTQQQLIQGLVGANAGAGTLQLVQGPGGQQFYIQSGPTSVSQQLTAGVIQQQQQVQIVVPGGQIGSNQPLLVKKLVKAVAAPSTLPQAQVAGSKIMVQANSQAPTPQPAVQQAVSSEGSTESQMASNQVTNATSVVTQSAPSPQQQTLITRTPGLPISIVSPSKGKVPSPNQQGTSSPSPSPLSTMPPSGPPKTGTVLRVSSPATNTPQTSVLKQSGTSQIMYTPPVTPTKSATKMVSPEAETERTAVNSSTSDSLGPSTVSTDTPSQPISVASQGMLQNTTPITSNNVNPVPTNSTALLTPSNTQSQTESGSQGNHTSLAEAQPTALRSATDTSPSPLPPTEASPKHTIQADNSAGNKITAKIFSTASGPKVVIQGINPDELTPSQLAQLQQQINKHWAAQQRMQGVSPQAGVTATGATVSAPAVMLPASSAVVHPSPSNVQSSAAAAGLSQQPASVSLPSILQKSQSGNASYAGSANVAQHLNPTEVLRASSSFAVTHAPPLSSPPPPRMLSPATVRSPPALSLATTPVQPGVVVRKSQARKSPIRPNNLDSPPPLVSPAPTPTQSLDLERQNHGNNDDVELTRPLNTQQQQELDDRRNSLKEDIMEKKKQAATQMRLEAQRGIQEKLQKQKAIELANSKAEEQKRVVVEQHNSVNDNSHKGAKKRKYDTGPGRNSTDQDPSSASTQRSSLQRRGPGSRGRGAGKKKKKHELYCICKTPYDDSKFYVGCDKCCNWYHGDCVGITQDMSKNLAEYICDDCREDDDNKLYCMCKKPYNESQFYIQCDKCEDWFHGRCVGVLQGESDYIGDYSCPGCEPNSDINLPNGKKLDAIDFAAIARLLKELLSNRLSLPFRKPVSKSEAPNYRSVIKEPMDLQTISNRVEARQYERLREFIGDVGRIFENCRYFNDSTTDIFRNADNLEKIFVQKINALRENLSSRAKQ